MTCRTLLASIFLTQKDPICYTPKKTRYVTHPKRPDMLHTDMLLFCDNFRLKPEVIAKKSLTPLSNRKPHVYRIKWLYFCRLRSSSGFIAEKSEVTWKLSKDPSINAQYSTFWWKYMELYPGNVDSRFYSWRTDKTRSIPKIVYIHLIRRVIVDFVIIYFAVLFAFQLSYS